MFINEDKYMKISVTCSITGEGGQIPTVRMTYIHNQPTYNRSARELYVILLKV